MPRQGILNCLGEFPKKIPLNLKIETTKQEDGYARSLLSFSVEERERITAWLLVPGTPKPEARWPAMLAIHQHGGEYQLGKSEPAGLAGPIVNHYGLDLCRKGYVVLCPDLLCFEDRRVDKTDDVKLADHDYEHFEFTKRVLNGSCLQTKYLHDLSCCIDLLQSLPEVNGEKIGTIGHSLGGQEALWITWYDERITCGVSSCGFGQIETILRDNVLHNRALYVPGMLQLGDLDLLLNDISPRPFMATNGESDRLFPIDGVREIASKTKARYSTLDADSNFQSLIFQGGHEIPSNFKSEMYSFFDKWLK